MVVALGNDLVVCSECGGPRPVTVLYVLCDYCGRTDHCDRCNMIHPGPGTIVGCHTHRMRMAMQRD